MRQKNKEIKTDCAICQRLGDTPFCGLAEDSLQKLDKAKLTCTYRRGQIVFREKELPTAIYCIRSGRVMLMKSGEAGRYQGLRFLGPGDLIGFRAVLADEPFAATAKMVDAGEICVIPREKIIALLTDSPELAFRMLKKLAQELRTSEEKMLGLIQYTVKQRAAQALLLLLDAGIERDRQIGRISVPVSRTDLAGLIATSLETLSRTLRSFANQGIIKATRSELVILQPDRLRRIAKSLA